MGLFRVSTHGPTPVMTGTRNVITAMETHRDCHTIITIIVGISLRFVGTVLTSFKSTF